MNEYQLVLSRWRADIAANRPRSGYIAAQARGKLHDSISSLAKIASIKARA